MLDSRRVSPRVALIIAIFISYFIFTGELSAASGAPALSMSRSYAEAGIPALYAAGDAPSLYTVDSASKAAIPPGTYTKIEMGAGFESFSIPSGLVTLLGGEDGTLVSPPLKVEYRHNQQEIAASPITIGSTSSAASLALIQGSLTGDIALGAGNSGRDATLIIGDPSSPVSTVNITGSILANLKSSTSSLVVDGADLNITGELGARNNTGSIGFIDAGGNITVSPNKSIRNVLGSLFASRVNIRAGKKIEASGPVYIRNAFLDAGSSLVASGPSVAAGRIDILNLIDGGANGALAGGSKIVSSNGSIWLWKGMAEGDGEINAGFSIGSHQGEDYPPGEIMVNPLTQGSGKLTLTAGKDISVGDMTVDSFSAGNDVVSGTEFSTNSANVPTANRVIVNNQGTSTVLSPRGTITARWAKAGGGIYAGKLNIKGVPGGDKAGVEAANLVVVQEKATTTPYELPSSTGDFALENGYFNFTGGDLGQTGGEIGASDSAVVPWGARIDGDMTVKGNGESSFKTMTVGGTASVSGGSLEGQSLHATAASFDNLSFLTLQDDLNSEQHPYAMETAGDATISGNQTAKINTAYVGGSLSATGGTYEGDAATAKNNATFAKATSLKINDELKTETGNITISNNGAAVINSLDSAGAFSLGGGTYEGTAISTGGDATLDSSSSLNVTGATTIGGALSATGNKSLNFASLGIGQNVVASGGRLSASAVETGTKEGANGDFEMTGGSFVFGATDASHIRGDLTTTDNGASSFGTLTIDGAAKIDGGSLSGASISSASGEFSNLSNLSVTDSLKTAEGGDLTISASGVANVKDAYVGGSASVSGGSYSGSVFSADKAIFSQMKNLTMTGKLTTTGDLSVGMTENGATRADAIEAGGAFALDGGSFAATSLKSEGDATLSNASSSSISGATTVGGDLNVSGQGTNSLGALSVGGSATVTDATLKATTIETGSNTGSGGDLTVTGGSFDLGSGNAAAGTIHGNLTINGLGSNSFTDLVVDEALNLSGGYLEGTSLSAKNATFKNNSVAHIDNFILGSDERALEIEEGSVVIVRTINNSSGLGEISDSGLIIAGDPDDPDSWSKLGDVDLSSGVLTAEKALVKVDSIIGKGQGADTDDVRAHKLDAGSINIEIANIQLTGIGEYASKVAGDLIITENRQTRLGDASVGGATKISGGSVQARQFSAAGDASFDNVELNLLGTGVRGSSVGGDLTIVNNVKSSLGDLTITGNTSVSGGSASAGVLTAEKDATFTGVELTLGGSDATPGKVGGDLALNQNKSAKLGAISVGGGLSADGGTLAATSLKVEKSAFLSGVNLSLNGGSANPDEIRGDLTLEKNAGASVNHLNVGGSLSVDGDSFVANGLNVGTDATFVGAETTLNGTAQAPDTIGGDLALNQNKSAKFGAISVGGGLSGDGGTLAATSLKVEKSALLSGVNLSLDGGSANPDEIRGDLTLEKSAGASVNHLNVGGSLSVDGDSFVANGLNVGTYATFVGAETTLNGTAQAPDTIGGDLALNQNKSAKFGAISVGGGLSGDGGTLAATSLKVEKSAFLSGVNLSLNGGSKTPDEIGGDLTLEKSAGASVNHLNVGGSLSVDGDSFVANGLNVGSDATFLGADTTLYGTKDNPDIIGGDLALNENKTAKFGFIEAGGTASVEGGTLSASSLQSKAANIKNAKSDISALDVKGVANFSRGTLVSDMANVGGANLGDGLIASLKNLILKDSTGVISATSGDASQGETGVSVDNLNLNGGSLKVGDGGASPAVAAVKSFASVDGSVDNINGHIGVGTYGRVILGTNDLSWVPASLAEARATLALARPMRLGANTGLHVTGVGSPQPVGGRINFDANSLFIIDGSDSRAYYTGEWVKSALLDTGNGAIGALSSDSSHTANIADGAKIYIRNPAPNTIVVALGQNIKTVYATSQTRASNGAAWTGANLDYDNKDAVKIERLDGDYAGQFSVLPREDTPPNPDNPDQPDNPEPGNPTQPDNPDQPSTPDTPSPSTPSNPSRPKPSETHPGADPGIHDVIQNETGKDNVGDQPRHMNRHNGAGFISHTFGHDDPHEATRIIEGAARIAVIGGVPRMTRLGNEAAAHASAQRIGVENMIWREDDIHARNIALWAVPLYRTASAWGLEAGNLDYDYHGGIGGVALGGDVTFDDLIRVGLAFHIGGGYAKSGGNLPDTSNNMSFWGLGAYAGWTLDNFGISADVNYTSTYNKLKQDVSELPGWSELKGDASAYALSARMKFDYRFATDFVDIIPHAGFKYHHIHVYGYDINHRGSTILSGEAFDQNIWTFPVGLKFAKEIEFASGWKLLPSLDLRVEPATGDIDAKTSVRFTETSGDIELKTKTMDYVVWGGTAGVEASLGNFTLGVNYSLEAGARSVYNSVFGVLRYEF